MKVVIWVIGILLMFLGIRGILWPQALKSNLEHLLHKEKHYFLIPILLFIGLLLIIASVKSQAKWLVFLLGSVFCLKGICLFVKPELMERVAQWWVERTERAYQIWGIVVYTLGVLLIIWS